MTQLSDDPNQFDIWLNPPRLEDPDEPVVLEMSHAMAGVLYEHLEATVHQNPDEDAQRALHSLKRNLDGMMQDPATTKLSREAHWHPRAQWSHLVPHVLTIAARRSGGTYLLANAIQYAAAIEYQRDGADGVHRLCDHAAGHLQDARCRRYGAEGEREFAERYPLPDDIDIG